ncbi:basic proline-rich protein-like [Caloenas nicobarica]|uniref:basic proline-rich protein-like n=1 Tax=Caloenas nicobarica TaxID=187106 RepID=UPI0032B873CB
MEYKLSLLEIKLVTGKTVHLIDYTLLVFTSAITQNLIAIAFQKAEKETEIYKTPYTSKTREAVKGPPTPAHSPQPRGADPARPSGAAPRPSSSRELHPPSHLPSGHRRDLEPRSKRLLSPVLPPRGLLASPVPAGRDCSRRRPAAGLPPPEHGAARRCQSRGCGRANGRRGAGGTGGGAAGAAAGRVPPATGHAAPSGLALAAARPVLSGPAPPRCKSPPGDPPLSARLAAAPLSGDDVASARHPHPGAPPAPGRSCRRDGASPGGGRRGPPHNPRGRALAGVGGGDIAAPAAAGTFRVRPRPSPARRARARPPPPRPQRRRRAPPVPPASPAVPPDAGCPAPQLPRAHLTRRAAPRLPARTRAARDGLRRGGYREL